MATPDSTITNTRKVIVYWIFKSIFESIELILVSVIGALFAITLQTRQLDDYFAIIVGFSIVGYLPVSYITDYLETYLNEGNTDQLDSFQSLVYDGFFSDDPHFTTRVILLFLALIIAAVFIFYTTYTGG